MATDGPPSAARRLDEVLKSKPKSPVEDEPLKVWDKGVFDNELRKQGIVLTTTPRGAIDGGLATDECIEQGTYEGTQMALTEIYSRLEDANIAYFHNLGVDPFFPRQRSLDLKHESFRWSKPAKDGYPPHLDMSWWQEKWESIGIFDITGSVSVATINRFFTFMIPDWLVLFQGTPFAGPRLTDCERYNSKSAKIKTDIMEGKNLGHEDDWYSDARFAQQHFSGVNPTTIEAASVERIKEYIEEATKQGLDSVKKLLVEGRDLLMQDYSYFREATGVANHETFENVIPEWKRGRKTGNNTSRYTCAPIIIFQLHPDGRLHPLAITLDYRGSLKDSVTIFNRRLTPDAGGVDEKEDWPWRYAKTCAQTADWVRHEVAVHLVDTHMVEEVIIVATNRTIPEYHLLYEILSPHWYRTLPLNASARSTLVPLVVARLSGLGPHVESDAQTNRTFKFLNYSYRNFDFQGKYVPNDLKKRGFDMESDHQTKYCNYPYATEIYMLWGVIRQFVKSVLVTKYGSDKDIQDDTHIAAWCAEIQNEGQLTSFPTITTVEQLVDAVTMCIHTASPQHTAVNYLQQYYYSFVPGKPPSLCTPLPKDLETLQGYKEKHLTAALPIGDGEGKWKDWLLAAQLPQLLSYRVSEAYNLVTYATSLNNVAKSRNIKNNEDFDTKAIEKAAKCFLDRLEVLDGEFKKISEGQTKGTVPYGVLQPIVTAVSILI
ncbi:hypothetical protein N3K66_005727 [Trichothecium roseum]|uniref:Uncharacterized protein n=1 Tax=Trichothecium roseum TaxID=47278 RepID=A0ACC0UYZ1_9HYPO|nr:hypothetical protein N3K66_005727 [Trichothecium roseum]